LEAVAWGSSTGKELKRLSSYDAMTEVVLENTHISNILEPSSWYHKNIFRALMNPTWLSICQQLRFYSFAKN